VYDIDWLFGSQLLLIVFLSINQCKKFLLLSFILPISCFMQNKWDLWGLTCYWFLFSWLCLNLFFLCLSLSVSACVCAKSCCSLASHLEQNIEICCQSLKPQNLSTCCWKRTTFLTKNIMLYSSQLNVLFRWAVKVWVLPVTVFVAENDFRFGLGGGSSVA